MTHHLDPMMMRLKLDLSLSPHFRHSNSELFQCHNISADHELPFSRIVNMLA